MDVKNLKVSKKEVNKIREKHKLGKSFTLLVVGGFIDFKRPQDAIKGFSILAKKGLDVKLVIVGVGSLVEDCKSLIKQLGIEDKVILTGRVSDKELAGYHNACDGLIFAAEQTWGLVPIESMACGKAVFVSNKAGVSEVINEGVTGFVFESRNTSQLAEKMEKVIVNRKLYNSISKEARKYAINNISWEKYGKDMERIFKEVLASKKEY